MKKLALLVIVGLVATAGSASAAQKYSATLAAPLAKDKDVIAGNNMFRCSGTTCELVSKPIDAGSVGTCRSLAREVGEIKVYGSADDVFNADKLGRCNGK